MIADRTIPPWIAGGEVYGRSGKLRTFLLPMNLYLQQVLNLDALHSGLALAPSPLVAMFVAPFAGRMSDKIGGKFILIAGLTLYATGMILMVSLATTDAHWYTFVPALMVAGLGTGCLLAPMATEAMRGVDRRLAGAASGVNYTVRQMGSVIGSAVVGALVQGLLASELRTEATNRAGALPTDVRGAFVDASVETGAAGKTGIGAHLPADLPEQVRQQAEGTFNDVCTRTGSSR